MTTAVQEGVRWSLVLDESVASLAPAPDARTLAVATASGELAVLSVADGSRVRTAVGHDGGALCLAWSPNGARLASGGVDGLVRLHTASDGRCTSTRVSGWVQALAWSPDGTRLAAAAGRALVLLGEHGELLHRWQDAPSTVTDIAWSRDGSRVAAAAYGGLRWYAAVSRSSRPVRTFDWQGSLLVVRVSPDGRWVASGNQDASVHVWRLWSGDDAEMTGYPQKVDALAFDRSSRWMACGGSGEISLWDFSGQGPTGRAPQMLPGHASQVCALDWQSTGDRLASAGRDGEVAVWAPGPKGTRTAAVLTADAGARVTGLRWTGDELAFGTVEGRVGVLAGPQ
jgi:WD40 repeat protein